MDKIEVSAPRGERRDRFFARSVGTSFDVRAADSATTQIDLYDEIGFWGVTAKDFRNTLKQATGDISLRINSGGGDVFDGISMYNDLLAYEGKVNVEITGVAASIASIIAMAGDTIKISENAFFMIHDAWTFAVGNRHDLTDAAAMLAKIDDALARTYAAQTSTGIREIKRMMDSETWMTAQEAVDAGFATEIVTHADASAKAKFDLSVYSNAPRSLMWNDDDQDDAPAATKRDMERALTRDAGWSRSRAREALREFPTSNHETTQDAGNVDLTSIAAALDKARAAFTTK